MTLTKLNIKGAPEYFDSYSSISATYYKRKIYPIHYIFSNTNLSIEMIAYFVLNNCKLFYENEDELIIKRLLNNTGLTKKKVIDILYYLKDQFHLKQLLILLHIFL